MPKSPAPKKDSASAKAPDAKKAKGEIQTEEPEVIEGELCPFCNTKNLILVDVKKEIPYFGACYIFSMDCKNCNYHKSDIERAEDHPPVKFTVTIDSEADMSIRVVKSSTASIKIPHVGSIEAGPASNGYVTNIEGILNRMKIQVEQIRDNDEEEDEARKKAKNLVKKLTRIMWGQEPCTITLEDPTGNSAIVSEKAKADMPKKS